MDIGGLIDALDFFADFFGYATDLFSAISFFAGSADAATEVFGPSGSAIG
ncbi:hypothetical protein OED52_09460 [Rhodococcus sp. Z13]|uniref:Uncharacterized protein n=1 Tax=Rhodococcus sacchari TaxID=2962047 RepID=A0ACD4DL67_9NOCA|nr:hypothetical protein [Rhodococcus sp. Z13]UYP20716.1 hypothetical protein OED52_09460 [Rhodococcus sp. Z13]